MGQIKNIETRMIEAQQRWGVVLKRKNVKEACGPCPFCSLADEDGFLVFGNGGFWCRQCGAKGWLDDNDAKPPTKQQLLERRVERLVQKQREQEQRLRRLEEMHACTDHLTYHSNLTSETRDYWRREGIYNEAIEEYTLGWCLSCPTYRKSASYTMPVLDRQGRLVNIRHRLIEPNGRGKYRPHMAGLGQYLFDARRLNEPHECVLILEGEKKSIIFNQHRFTAVGLMGKSFKWKSQWFAWFQPHGKIIIALDPDAIESAWRLGEMFAKRDFENVFVANFATKPDDAIVKYGARLEDIELTLANARPVRAQ